MRRLRDLLKALTFFKDRGKCILEIQPESFKPLSILITANEGIEDFSFPAKIADMGISILHKFGFTDKDILVSPKDLSHFAGRIRQLYDLIFIKDPGKKDISVSFVNEDEEITRGRKVACFALISAPIGDQTVGCLIGFIGSAIPLGNNQYKVMVEDLKTECPMLARTNETIEETAILNMFEPIAKDLREKGIIPIRLVR
jgi:hypothetical protein